MRVIHIVGRNDHNIDITPGQPEVCGERAEYLNFALEFVRNDFLQRLGQGFEVGPFFFLELHDRILEFSNFGCQVSRQYLFRNHKFLTQLSIELQIVVIWVVNLIDVLLNIAQAHQIVCSR